MNEELIGLAIFSIPAALFVGMLVNQLLGIVNPDKIKGVIFFIYCTILGYITLVSLAVLFIPFVKTSK